MEVEIKLPELGEEAGEATVSFWIKGEGELVEEGEEVVEMITDKATFRVESPVKGRLKEIRAQEGEKVGSGGILAVVEAN